MIILNHYTMNDIFPQQCGIIIVPVETRKILFDAHTHHQGRAAWSLQSVTSCLHLVSVHLALVNFGAKLFPGVSSLAIFTTKSS